MCPPHCCRLCTPYTDNRVLYTGLSLFPHVTVPAAVPLSDCGLIMPLAAPTRDCPNGSISRRSVSDHSATPRHQTTGCLAGSSLGGRLEDGTLTSLLSQHTQDSEREVKVRRHRHPYVMTNKEPPPRFGVEMMSYQDID
ncbi:hypothetical protein J6590_050660 [Homalodisca vitripennis]|nr:hypothetical protein J6590_050660 [Homalodisca vitripennis]